MTVVVTGFLAALFLPPAMMGVLAGAEQGRQIARDDHRARWKAHL